MNAPKRWKEPGSEASPDLRSVLEYAAKRAPDAIYVATLTGAVLSQLAAPTPALGTATAIKASAGTMSGKLLGLALSAVIVGAGGVALYVARERTPAASRAVANIGAAGEQTAAPLAHEQEPGGAPASVPEVTTAEVLPPKSNERAVRSRSSHAQVRPSVNELELLQAARIARRASDARALTLLEEHERLFPDSHLREEREVLLIELLSHQRPRAAARRAADFVLRFPNSPYRQRIIGLELPTQ